MKLIERLAPVKSVNLSPKTQEVKKASTAYALSKVVDRLLGVKSETNLKFADSRHFADLVQMLPDEMTDEQRVELNKGHADLVLVAFHKGFVRVVKQVDFELYWNVIDQQKRANTQVLRSYWLGNSFEFDLEPIKFADNPLAELENLISERLVSDIVWFVENYKANPPQLKKFDHARGHEIVRKKGNWRDRYINRWSDVGMQYSTYTYRLIKELAEQGTIPVDIPPDVLTVSEREQILERLGLNKKLTDNKPKKEAA